MHDEILSRDQKKLLPFLKTFRNKFYLAGGTALALQLGHRRSIDFDLLTPFDLKTQDIRNRLGRKQKIEAVLVDEAGEFTAVIQNVKVTFLKYPFEVSTKVDFNGVIKMLDILVLGAMKAYFLGRRAKWKDYVDLYFIIKKFSFKELVNKAKKIFTGEFNEKLFREQLAYFEDIDYSEKINFMKGFETSDENIKRELIEFSLTR